MNEWIPYDLMRREGKSVQDEMTTTKYCERNEQANSACEGFGAC